MIGAFTPGQRIHLVGVGGAGLSAIARVLAARGCVVSGSDRAASPVTAALAREGVQVHIGHASANVQGAEVVIASSAIAVDAPELLAAQAHGVPVLRRQQVWGPLLAGRHVVAVAGTHGKTTTSALVVHLLRASGRQPGYIVGGTLLNTGTNADDGADDTFVVEADEYDRAFLGLYPALAVITNVEWDHPDHFPAPTDLHDAFLQFVRRLPRDHGVLVACADDDGARMLAAQRQAERGLTFLYGFAADATLRATDLHATEHGTRFTVVLSGQPLGEVHMPLPGAHMVQNALAALYVAATGHDQPFDAVLPHLATFAGTGRRFEVRYDDGVLAVVDDYAHHPTAIRANIEAARGRFPGRALWVVWQPHTYSRTHALWDAYLGAFDAADHVLITDVYAAREQPLPGVDAARLVAGIGPKARHTPSLDVTAATLLAQVGPPAAVLIFSAGDAPQVGEAFLRARGLA